MFLVFSIFVLFGLYAILVFFEDNILKKNKNLLYWATCILLVIMAGTREVGFDPDSKNYESYFLYSSSENFQESLEISYVIIAQFLNAITNDVHSLFFIYAILGVCLKFIAFRHYDNWLAITFVYICFYFQLHETCQIRAGVLSGCFLMAVPYIAEGKRLIALLWILTGCFFHLSGIMLLPLLFLSNKPLGRNWKLALFLSIPFSYIFSGLNLGLELASDIPYIGQKIAFYSDIEEKGKVIVSSLNLFSPLHLIMVAIFYYLLFWADAITNKTRYFPLMIKIFAIALMSYALFSFIPVIGERMGSMYRTITVVLLPVIIYTLQPKWSGIILLILISFILLIFSLNSMYHINILLPPIK